MKKVGLGAKFLYGIYPAITINYDDVSDMWLCEIVNTNYKFWKSNDAIAKQLEAIKKGEKELGMNIEWKFYERNLAPKWLEGDYDLHIEGNRMTMTSKEGKKVETRCHPDDDWQLQVGIDELKERMAEVKKPREIKVGDKVKFKRADCYNAKQVIDFFSAYKVPTQDVIDVAQANATGNWPNKIFDYTVKYLGYYTNVIDSKLYKVALVQSNATGSKFVTDYANLEMVAE